MHRRPIDLSSLALVLLVAACTTHAPPTSKARPWRFEPAPRGALGARAPSASNEVAKARVEPAPTVAAEPAKPAANERALVEDAKPVEAAEHVVEPEIATPIEPVRVPDALRGDPAIERAKERVTTALNGAATVELVLDMAAKELVADGFALHATKDARPQHVVARAKDVRGAIYALNELARMVRVETWTPGDALDLVRNPAFDFRLGSMHDNPGEPVFDTRFRDPKLLVDQGFNGMILHGLAGLCTYDDFDERLVPKDSPERKTVLAARQRIKRIYAEAKRNHLMVFLNGDELCVPRTALDLYGDEVLAPNAAPGRFLLSPCKPKVHALVRATFEELLKLFPDVDGFQVRTGEVYTQSEPTLFGHMPTKGIDPTCADWSREDKLRALVKTITDVVCVEHGKRFNLRMWGYYNSAHSDPAQYAEFADVLEPNPLRTFSFKQTKTDYWRWNALNPNFGVGEHAQWAEFQMAREYEGKGAFPSYLGRYLAEGPTECTPTGGIAAIRSKGVRGAWCWARGGGWNGPFPAREDWIALNVHAFVRLLWDPSEDPWRIAREWSVLELGLAPRSIAADRFVKIQKLSEEALLASRYIGAFIEKGHLKAGSGWTPDGNWSRDDKLGVDATSQPAAMFYAFLQPDGAVTKAIDEREHAIATWKELVDEFERLRADVANTPSAAAIEELYDTAVWGQRAFDATSHGFAAGWLAYAWRDGEKKDAELARRARAHLDEARAAWKDYSERVVKLAGVATPYRLLGFDGEWDAIEALLDGKELPAAPASSIDAPANEGAPRRDG